MMFFKLQFARAAIVTLGVCAIVEAGPVASNSTTGGPAELPVVDLGYQLHQAAWFNVSFGTFANRKPC
jgi:hypothetical protein